MSKAVEQLAVAARKVSGLATNSWDELLVALRAYCVEKDKDLREAPIDRLGVLQGHAQCAAQLLKHFEECRSIAERVESKKQ